MIGLHDWPTTAWKRSTPEKEGMNSEMLSEGYATLTRTFPALRQLTIVRHGCVVFHQENPRAREFAASVVMRRLLAARSALYGCPREIFVDEIDGRWNVRSVAKSVTSMVIGIVLDDGALESLDQRVADLLPELFTDDVAADKRQITLRHLLTMTSGLRSVEGGRAALQMTAEPHLARFMVSLPLESVPGERFVYNTANAHLLSAVVSRVTGRTLREYACTSLFGPLGIEDVVWGAGPEGLTFGGGNLFLSSGDLAKLGLLYLHGGLWEEHQLVPAAWVAASLRPYQTYVPGWDYGYYWYLHEEEDRRRGRRWATFSAAGTGGQKVLVIPDLELILAAVARTDFVGEKGIHLNRAVAEYLLPAVEAV